MTPILPTTKKRRSYRVPLGMPNQREDWRMGSVVSTVVHLAILMLLLSPLAMMGDVFEMPQGAGGAGPAGGGGGGTRGSGSMRAEMLRFVRVAPPPPVPAQAKPVVPPLVVPPTPQPQVQAPKEPELTMITGTGGGTGADNTTGTGSGTGGGVGTGVGTGRGSGIGAGTGGGTQADYPPSPTEMFLPPLPVPPAARGFHVIVEFDVDETGRVLSMKFTETRDRGYNRRLADVFRGFRFRPGTRPDGTPIRMKTQISVDLP